MKKRIGVTLAALLLAFCCAFTLSAPVFAADKDNCTSILPSSLCSMEGGQAIFEIIRMLIKILSGGVIILAILGISICGYIWMTARDDEAKVKMAKQRMEQIVIGLLIYALIAFCGTSLLNWWSPNAKEAVDDIVTSYNQVMDSEVF